MQIELMNDRLKSNDKVSMEIERLKEVFNKKNSHLASFDDAEIRTIVEYIRVMPDEKIIIVLKGGLQIEEVL